MAASMPRILLILGILLLEAVAAPAANVDRLLADAAAEIDRFSFDRAYEGFDRAMRAAPPLSTQWQQAIFGAAVCSQQASPASPQRIDRAIHLFTQLVERCPDSRFTPRAMMNLGRIAELSDYYKDVINLPLARTWYQRVIDRWPDDAIAGEATLRLAANYILTYEIEQVRQGITILESWLARHPYELLASGMWQYLGDTYFYPLDDAARAVACYEKADALGWAEPGRQGPTLWRMAVLCERLNVPARAVVYYTKIIEETPASGKAYEAQLALKRLNAPVPPIRLFRTLPATTQGSGRE